MEEIQGVKRMKLSKKFNPNAAGTFSKTFAETTRSERVHASDAGQHVFTESGLCLIDQLSVTNKLRLWVN